MLHFSSVQSLSRVRPFATPWTAACQVSLSITNSQSLLKLMSIVSVNPSNHLHLCPPLCFLPSIFPSIRVFSNESVLRIRWPTYWSFSFRISPSDGYIFPFPLCLQLVFFSQLFVRLPQTTIFLLAFLFLKDDLGHCLLYNIMNLRPQFFRHSIRSNPLNLFVKSTKQSYGI